MTKVILIGFSYRTAIQGNYCNLTNYNYTISNRCIFYGTTQFGFRIKYS